MLDGMEVDPPCTVLIVIVGCTVDFDLGCIGSLFDLIKAKESVTT